MRRYIKAINENNSREYFACEGDDCKALEQLSLTDIETLIRERCQKQFSRLEWMVSAKCSMGFEPDRIPNPDYEHLKIWQPMISKWTHQTNERKRTILLLNRSLALAPTEQDDEESKSIIRQMITQRLKKEETRVEKTNQRIQRVREMETRVSAYESSSNSRQEYVSENKIVDWTTSNCAIQVITLDKSALSIIKRETQTRLQNQLQKMIENVNQQRKQIDEFKKANVMLLSFRY